MTTSGSDCRPERRKAIAVDAVTAPIVGASRAEQLDASLAAADVAIDEELAQRLNDLTWVYRMGDAPR